jgi:hypothetical protein
MECIVVITIFGFVLSLPLSALIIKQDPSHDWLQGSVFSDFAFIGVLVMVIYKLGISLEPHQITSFLFIVVGVVVAVIGKTYFSTNISVADGFTNAGIFLIGVGAGFYGGFGSGIGKSRNAA